MEGDNGRPTPPPPQLPPVQRSLSTTGSSLQRKISTSVEAIRNRVRKITPAFHDGLNSLRQPAEGARRLGVAGDLSESTLDINNDPTGSNNTGSNEAGHSRVSTVRAPTPEELQIEMEKEIALRVTELQREGKSNPAFEKSAEDASEDYPEEAADIVGALQTHMGRKRFVPVSETEAATRKISVGYDPSETVPSVDNYELSKAEHHLRPTLADLRFEKAVQEEDTVRNTGNENKLARTKLGWIRGVVLWSVLNLWGVMLFLRMAWMTAQAGMGLFLLIVLIGTAIAILTSLSTSAISTNGEIGTGGTYFMISRSLGPQFGAAIGIIFTLANIINVSLNIQGFADVLTGLIETAAGHMIDHLNDTRIIAVITLVLLTAFTFFGMEIASRLQMLFFVILVAAMLNIVIGSFIPPNLENQANGFVGYSSALFRENFGPAFQTDRTGNNSFMSVFGVFFPSVTGILAGTSITGDLRDPSGAIPKGTIVAVIFTSCTYILMGWITLSVTLRHASGNISDLLDGNLTACAADRSCTQGSIDNFEIMEVVAHFKPIVLAGIFAATLSTALGCINFAPKIFQALCRDRIFPGIHIFGKGYGKNDEPYRAYGLVMIIAVAFLMPADLNFISNIVSNCFLLTYALVNYATFDASFSQSPGWRPTFKYYNQWLSLATGLACVILMFLLDWMSAIIAIGIIFVLWLYVYHKDPQVNWGTSGEANVYKRALRDSLGLLKIQDHVKNYRPQILLLCGLPCARPALVHFAHSITRGTGMLICGHVLVGGAINPRQILAQEIYKWLRRRKLKAFYDYVAATKCEEGMKALIQTSGLGKLKPNIILMGYQQSWLDWTEDSIDAYISVINHAFDANMAVAILYAKEGFDITEAINFERLVRENADDMAAEDKETSADKKSSDKKAVPLEVLPTSNPVMQSRIALVEKFEPGKRKTISGEIHVWWLYDDGGLTLLIPYLLTRRTPWSGCRLKVFCLAGTDRDAAHKNMKGLLDKFRIQAEVIPVDMEQAPSLESKDWFNNLIMQYRVNDVTRRVSGLDRLREADLVSFSQRTMKQIRLRELLLEYSSKSALNVVTMPLPKKGRNSLLYMVVLDTLTRELPLTLLIRGTQESVLTFYC